MSTPVNPGPDDPEPLPPVPPIEEPVPPIYEPDRPVVSHCRTRMKNPTRRNGSDLLRGRPRRRGEGRNGGMNSHSRSVTSLA
jgi:hypothetical protein